MRHTHHLKDIYACLSKIDTFLTTPIFLCITKNVFFSNSNHMKYFMEYFSDTYISILWSFAKIVRTLDFFKYDNESLCTESKELIGYFTVWIWNESLSTEMINLFEYLTVLIWKWILMYRNCRTDWLFHSMIMKWILIYRNDKPDWIFNCFNMKMNPYVQKL